MVTIPRLTGLAAALVLFSASAGAGGGSRSTASPKRGTIRIGYRADAPPFSSASDAGEPRGYSIDICKKVVEALGPALKRPGLATEFVLVTAADRFAKIESGAVDLLCEPTTVTMARRERVDFSLLTFISGAGIAVRADGTQRVIGPGGPRVIGVLKGTTTEQQLRAYLGERGLDNPVVLADTHEAGLAMLLDKQVDGYFADRELLLRLAAEPRRAAAAGVGPVPDGGAVCAGDAARLGQAAARRRPRDRAPLPQRRGRADLRLVVPRRRGERDPAHALFPAGDSGVKACRAVLDLAPTIENPERQP